MKLVLIDKKRAAERRRQPQLTVRCRVGLRKFVEDEADRDQIGRAEWLRWLLETMRSSRKLRGTWKKERRRGRMTTPGPSAS